MFRSMMFSLVMLGVVVAFATAEPVKTKTKIKTDTKAKEAKLTKVDAKKGTVSAKVKVDGKDVEKTFKLAEKIEYADSTGKVATIDIFTSGDQVLMIEEEGTISKLSKCDKPSTEKKPSK